MYLLGAFCPRYCAICIIFFKNILWDEYYDYLHSVEEKAEVKEIN